MKIRVDDLSGAAVQSLLAFHLSEMQGNSPKDCVNALDLSGLQASDVTVWTVWEDDALMGVGALKQLSPTQGEIKSMRTDPQHLKKGVGAALLDHIVAAASDRGYGKLSLETGSGPEFEAALSLYRKRGFEKGEAFAGYEGTAFNQFFHLNLQPKN